MDLYKLAIRWATDRIGDQGIVAFVTPNGYLDGNAESGMRACLADEYHSLYLLNLRGDARLSGEARRREKGNVFGSSTRVGILVSVLIKHPQQPHPDGQSRIWYHDVGDYLTAEQKNRPSKTWGMRRRAATGKAGNGSNPTATTTGSTNPTPPGNT